MASSGSFTTSSCQSRSLKFSWSIKSQSVENNQTTISWSLVGSGSASGYVKCGGFYVKINGVVKVDKSTDYRVEVYNGTTVASGTATISHNSDGTKSFSAEVQAGIYYYARNCSGSGTWTLTTIPRASSISSAANKTLGNACSVKWTPYSKSFSFKLKFVLGDWSYTTGAISPNSTSAYTYTGYTLPVSVANYITTATSATMTVYLYTYSSSACSTQIGSRTSKTFTVTVPSSVIPTISSLSATIDNSANSVIKGWGIAVAGYTKVKVTAAASGSYGSTISSFDITGGYNTSVNGTSLAYTGGIISSSGDKVFDVVAKDSRGRSSSQAMSNTITFYAYSKPSMSVFTVARSSSDGTKMVVRANWSFASVNGKNSVTATLQYKKSTASSWTTYGTISKNTSVTLDATFDEASSYNFKIVVKDALSNSASAETFVSTVEVLLDFRAGGKGLGIGKIAETDSMEVALDAKFMGTVYIYDSSGNELTLEEYIKALVSPS